MVVITIKSADADRAHKFCEDNHIDVQYPGYGEPTRGKYEMGFKSDIDADLVLKYLRTKQPLRVQSKEEWLKEQLGQSESGSKKT